MFKVMVACSVVCTVFILNFHERTVDTHEVSTRNLRNHMKTWHYVSLYLIDIVWSHPDASVGGVHFPPVVAMAAQDGQAWKTLDCKVNPTQVKNKQILAKFWLSPVGLLTRQRLRQLEQGDKPAHPGLVTPGTKRLVLPSLHNFASSSSLAPFFFTKWRTCDSW